MPHSRGLKKADLVVKDFSLAGIRDLIIDVSLRHEFRGACADPARNGEASHADANGALDAAVRVAKRSSTTTSTTTTSATSSSYLAEEICPLCFFLAVIRR